VKESGPVKTAARERPLLVRRPALDKPKAASGRAAVFWYPPQAGRSRAFSKQTGEAGLGSRIRTVGRNPNGMKHVYPHGSVPQSGVAPGPQGCAIIRI
jgi:hypothetical protein